MTVNPSPSNRPSLFNNVQIIHVFNVRFEHKRQLAVSQKVLKAFFQEGKRQVLFYLCSKHKL
jgi:hypothetical protein